jgi:hypothetical protein
MAAIVSQPNHGRIAVTRDGYLGEPARGADRRNDLHGAEDTGGRHSAGLHLVAGGVVPDDYGVAEVVDPHLRLIG